MTFPSAPLQLCCTYGTGQRLLLPLVGFGWVGGGQGGLPADLTPTRFAGFETRQTAAITVRLCLVADIVDTILILLVFLY